MTLVERWAAENPRSRALHERVSASLPGGLAHDVRRGWPFPLAVERVQGARKWDADADPDAVEQALASGDVAAVVLEPSGAAWGAMPLSPAFLAGLREPRLQEEGLL